MRCKFCMKFFTLNVKINKRKNFCFINVNFSEEESNLFTHASLTRQFQDLFMGALFIQESESQPYCFFNQKLPCGGVPRTRCSGNMGQVYRRKPMPKCGFNKVALHFTSHLDMGVLL